MGEMNFKHGLNEEQCIAVDTLEGPLLVLAGAGSGKTRVVTCRIVNLIEKGVDPEKILGLTFTNKAAQEMQERVRQLTENHVLICTFHSLGVRILRESAHHLGLRRDFTIYDDEDVNKLLKACLEEALLEPSKEAMKGLKYLNSHAKSKLNPEQALMNFHQEHIPSTLYFELFRKYQSKLRECNAVDYDDLLTYPVQLFHEHPLVLQQYQERWSHLLIDEYQDTNPMQYFLIELLVKQHRNVCAVGDPDQSIYSWRGANVQNILNFERDYPGARVIFLNQNYRSRTNILNAANALITRNQGRYEKNLWSALGAGEKIKIYRADTGLSEAYFVGEQILRHYHYNQIPLKQNVVFYRTNAQSRSFEDYFLKRRIPYVVVGGLSFYQRKEIKDILAWLRVVYSDADYISFLRTINLPKRGLGENSIDKLYQGALSEGLSIIEFCCNLIEGKNTTPLKLTPKQRQGLEQYVTIIHALRKIKETDSLAELIDQAITLTKYREYLDEDLASKRERLENLGALVTKAREWGSEESAQNSLGPFLEELSLRSSVDEMDGSEDRVQLMTVHHGKGLEFTATFLVGMEEGLFPHINSAEQEDRIEEERRLCYVGMTRAKEFLYLTYAKERMLWGAVRKQKPSSFLAEIPREFMQFIN